MWKTVELKDICQDFKKDIVDGPFGANLKSEHFQEEGVPVLKIQNVKEFALNRKKMVYISQKKYQELRRHNFQSGDLIMTKLGAPLGVTAIVDDLEEGVIVADLVRIRIDETEAIGRFIEYQLNSASIRKQINSAAKGATRPRITLGVVRTLKLLLPPLPEQQRIVAKLDAAFAEIDRAIDVAESKYTEVEKLKAALLASALRGEDWKTVKLGDVCELVGGGTPSKKNATFYGGAIPWATVRDMHSDELQETELKITELGLNSSSSKVIPANNVVIASRVGLGKVCLLAQDTAINQDLRGVLPKAKNTIDARYLFYWVKSIGQTIISAGRGATVHGVTLPFLKALELPLPPLLEQKRIVAKLDTAFAEIDKSAENISEVKAHYLALKSAILAQELQPPEIKAA